MQTTARVSAHTKKGIIKADVKPKNISWGGFMKNIIGENIAR